MNVANKTNRGLFTNKAINSLLTLSISAGSSAILIGFLRMPLCAAERQALQGHVPAAVASQAFVGRLSTSKRLALAIELPLRNRTELRALLEEIYDPNSVNFHHYLTPDQFAERFGPTEDDYQAVIAFARANGFTVTAIHPNRTLLDVNATVADIERAFQVTLRVHQHPKETLYVLRAGRRALARAVGALAGDQRP